MISPTPIKRSASSRSGRSSSTSTPPSPGPSHPTEAVIATNDFWFDILGFTLLRVPKAIANLASRRISEKTGMRLVATEPDHAFVRGHMPAEIWELTRDEWHAFRGKLTSRR